LRSRALKRHSRTLAHHGVLILGEFTEFRGNAVGSLLQPLDQRRVVVTRMVGLARMRTMSDEPVVPDQEATAEGYTVFWEPAHYPADDIEAELPDGTRLTAILSVRRPTCWIRAPVAEGNPAPAAWTACLAADRRDG
jgi:hypothetical protein